MADIRSFFSSATAATQASSNEAETTRQDSTNNNCHDTFNLVAGHPAATQPVNRGQLIKLTTPFMNN